MDMRMKGVRRLTALLLMTVMMLDVTAAPITALGTEIAEGITSVPEQSGQEDSHIQDTGQTHQPSLEDIQVPTYGSNPYPLQDNRQVLPIYTWRIYDYLRRYETAFSSYESLYQRTEERSQYYTGSVLVLADRAELPWSTPTSELPYTESRALMFHPELTVSGEEGELRGTLYAHQYEYATPRGDSMWNYLDPDQVQMLVSGRILSGNGELWVYHRDHGYSSQKFEDSFTYNINAQGYKTTLKTLGEGETYDLTVQIPISENTESISVDYLAWNDATVITDPHAVLIDDSAPYIKSVDFDMEKGLRDDEADLIMRVTLNEGIRYLSDYRLEEFFSQSYVTVNVWNATKGQSEIVKLYLYKVDGGKVIEFRANIGRLHYCNLTMGFVSAVNIPRQTHYPVHSGFLDLADGMVLGAGNVQEYGNRVISPRFSLSTNGITSAFFLGDHAGNSLDLTPLYDWKISSFRFNADSFEAEEVRIYNDKTLGVEQGTTDATAAREDDLFVGPNRDLTVHVRVDRELEQVVWEQVFIKLNVLDTNGEPLKLYPTSAGKYVNNEVYADGVKTGTILKYENIPLTVGMTVDVPEGREARIRVTEMGTDYTREETGYPTAYPYVKDPDSIMYGDFTPPAVTVRKTVERVVTAEAAPTVYRVTAEVLIEETPDSPKVVGLRGGEARIGIGGGVEKETKIRYVLTDDPVPPEDPAAYDREAYLVPNGMVTLGTMLLLNNTERLYIHMLTESNQIYLNGLQVDAQVSDLVGNVAAAGLPGEIEYLIDEIPPTVAVLSKTAVPTNGNSTILLTVDVEAADHTRVDQVLYCFGGETPADDAEWSVAVIEAFGSSVTASLEREYGDANHPNPDENRIYTEILWVKAMDSHGNESQPLGTEIRLSLAKPSAVVEYHGIASEIHRGGELLISGPEASLFDGDDAYTRITLTPLGDETYAYVTLVKTGQKDVDILSLTGLTWYRVKVAGGRYEEVSAPLQITESYGGNAVFNRLTDYYGDLRITLENGYGSMTPAVGDVSSMANAGSYMADPDEYVLRYASPLRSGNGIHGVDFGQIMDYAMPFGEEETIRFEGKTVVEDADPGAAPYLFKQAYKGVNPMRNAQIHFSIANLAQSSFALKDFDYLNSYAELMLVGEGGDPDRVVARQDGLWATGSQYFTIGNTMDNGDAYVTGAYYLRVTVVTFGGQTDSFESSRLVLDAQTADTAGLWEYTYRSVADITNTQSGERYADVVKTAEDQPFEDIGIAVIGGEGETSRNRFFATYSYGVAGLTVSLRAPDTVRTVEGLTLGAVEGFKIWNLLSAPTEDEIHARRFEISGGDGVLTRTVNTEDIYTSETIPTGLSGMSRLYLIKGTNTICYQVKLENGYVSPVRRFTITVTDEVPVLSVSIGGYQPSLHPSQKDGIINADHIRYYVDTAYSVNGSGNVNVELWSSYGLNLGLWSPDGGLVDTYVETPQPDHIMLQKTYEGLQVEEYADLTQNTYTSNFPESGTYWCTAVFVAEDEYGGVSVVAPQIGDMERINVNEGVIPYGHEIRINYYGRYFEDPYTVGDSLFGWRVLYNQPVYYGSELRGFESYLVENTADGEVRVRDIQTADPSLRYNQFNISTNDIALHNGEVRDDGYCATVRFEPYRENGNLDLVLRSDATVTLSGGYVGDTPVTLAFLSGNVITLDENGDRTEQTGNDIGYMSGYGESALVFSIAYPQATADKPAGTRETLRYTLRYTNAYGDVYEKSGDVTVTYIDYSITKVTMTESGAVLSFGFAVKDQYNSGVERTGNYQNGSYEVTLPDYFGSTVTLRYTVSNQTDPDTRITYKKFTNTANPVIITLENPYGVYVDVTDYEVMNVEYGEGLVTVTVNRNTRFSYRYKDADGNERMYAITVDNIYRLAPNTILSVPKGEYNIAEDGTKYRYGTVTVYLTDPNFSLVDQYTGKMPTFTFLPGGEGVYTFRKEDIVARIGDEERPLDEDITVILDYVLYEVPELEFSVTEDEETPNVRVRAYAKLGEAYFDTSMAMTLTGTRHSSAFPHLTVDQHFEYIGNRANMTEALERMGWSDAYRFTVDTVDSSRVRLFIREGLYAEAPDFHTGVSEVIEGVQLNSKLLTVTKNAKFTLFAVDSFNNATSVAFNVTGISEAPVPTVEKIPMGFDSVRLYLIAPEGVSEEDLKILSPTELVDSDPQSPYYLKKYIEIKANDDYDIVYEIKYQGVTVTDTLKGVSVSEISPDEMVMQGLAWSANKASEATPHDVSVDIQFSHNVSEIRAVDTFDPARVRFDLAGNTLKVTFSDNHPTLRFTAVAENGTFVTVTLDAVTSIDREAPEIGLVSETLAPNGRSLTLILSSSEQASFREGNGRLGEAVTDGAGNTRYHYTVKITQNGEYTYTFADMSGIMTTFTYKATALVPEEFEVIYNTRPEDEGAVTDPSALSLETGTKVFVKPSRAVSATLTGLAELLAMAGGEWLELTIPAASEGIPPYIIYTDEYGNVLTHQFSTVAVPDRTAPTVVVSKMTYAVKVGTPREQVMAALMANFAAFDDADDHVTRTVQFTENTDVEGLTDVTYTATDSAGNVTEAFGKLRITSIYEPVVTVNGIQALRDEGIRLKSGEAVTLRVDAMGVGYKVVLAEGLLTAAQMKGMDAVGSYTASSDIEPGILPDGVYTVLIITERREYFRLFIAVQSTD